MSTRIPFSLALLFALVLAAPARADDDMGPFRERFRSGMERYTAGDVAGAIRFWEPIYAELGPAKGYRLSFNLARAYEKFGDLPRAADRYESFLSQVDARRAAGEALDPKVATEETEARARVAEIYASRGRIAVRAGASAASVQVDALEPRLAPFTALVVPGAHVVTFDPGGPNPTKRDVQIAAGQVVEVTPPAPPPPAPSPPPPPPPAPVVTRIVHEVDRPYSPVWIYVAGGVTAASAVVCIVEYTRALSIKHDFASSGTQPADLQDQRVQEYNGVRSDAYAALGVSLGLLAVTTGLTTWYLAATKERDVVVPVTSVTPTAGATAGGAWIGATGRF